MKKLLIITIFTFTIYSAQEQAIDRNLIVYPTTPEVSKLFNINEPNIDEFKGEMIYDINLANVELDEISFPINLNYRYSGFKPTDTPSTSGVGWHLNAFGSIAREIKGIPDEHPTKGYFANKSRTNARPYYSTHDNIGLFNLFQTWGSCGAYSELEYIYNGNYDTERDIYHVRFNDIIFSFQITDLGQPFYLTPTNCKVIIEFVPSDEPTNPTGLGNIQQFVVQDDQGILFEFGKRIFDPLNNENNYVDFIEPLQGNNPNNTFWDNFQKYKSSWHITKIITPKKNEINFEYENNYYETVNFSASGIRNEKPLNLIENNITGSQCAIYFELASDITNFESNADIYNESANRIKNKTKILNKITYEGSEIQIIYKNSDESNSNYVFKVIDEIEVKNLKNEIIKQYEFKYIRQRHLLTEIKLNNTKWYEFDYWNQLDMPYLTFSDASLAKKTDYNGYYNGSNNTKFLDFRIGEHTSSVLANKTPNFSATLSNALKRIHLPTGGYQQIEYEQNTIKCNDPAFENVCTPPLNLPNFSIDLRFKTDYEAIDNGECFCNNCNTPPFYVNPKYKRVNITFTEPTFCNLQHWMTTGQLGTGQISASIRRIDNSGLPSESNYYQQLDYLRLTNPGVQYPFLDNLRLNNILDDAVPGPQEIYQSSNGNFFIAPSTYEIEIFSTKNNVYAEGYIKLEFYQPVLNQSINRITSGIRVKEIKHVDDSNISYSKFYDYNNDNGESYGISLPTFDVRPITHKYNTFIIDTSVLGGTCTVNKSRRAHLISNNLSESLIYKNNGTYYSKIRVHNGSEEEVIPTENGIIDFFPSASIHEQEDTCYETEYNTDNTPYLNWDGTEVFNYLGSEQFPTLGILNKKYTKGYIEKSFHTPEFNPIMSSLLPRIPKNNLEGKLIEQKTYVKKDFVDIANNVNEIKYQYEIEDYSNSQDFVLDAYKMQSLRLAKKIHYFPRSIGGSGSSNLYCTFEAVFNHFDYVLEYNHDLHYRNNKIIEKTFFDNQLEITNTTDYTFDNYNYLSSITRTNSNNQSLVKNFYRSYNFNDLISQSMQVDRFYKPVKKIEILNNGILINTEETDYKSIFNNNSLENGRVYLPEFIKSKKGNNSYNNEFSITYNSKQLPNSKINSNDNKQNEYFIYGYDNLIVLKIQNFDPGDGFNYSLENTINSNSLNLSELEFRNYLNGTTVREYIQSFSPNALITTYTHKPLVGVTSVTDPKGDTQTYEYDSFNRLKEVRDKDNNLLQEHQHHYRPQN